MLTVSVVIPTFNRAAFLEEALRTVHLQTLRVAEIVVVDDGSTDNTREVVQSMPGVRYIYQQNAGPAAARNRGIREANGDLIAFLDSDDLWVPEKTAIQVEFLSSHQRVDICFGLMANFEGDPSLAEPEIKDQDVYQALRDGAADVKDIFSLFLRWNAVPTPAVVMRKNCFQRSGYFPENMRQAEDYALWLRAATCCQWGFIDKVLLLRRRHETNLVNSWFERKQLVGQLLKSLLESDIAPGQKALVSQKLNELYYDLGSNHLRARRFADAAGAFSRMDPQMRRPLWYPKYALSALLSGLGSAGRPGR